MPRPFVILFRAREGSSALVSLLGQHPAITLPLFEELDEYEARRLCDHASIARLAGQVLACGDRAEAERRYAAAEAEPAPRTGRAVGFKWRIWGDAEQVAETLARHGVTVFHLYRRRLRLLVASMMLTDEVLPALADPALPRGEHLQFAFAAMNATERAGLQHRLGALRFDLDLDRVRATAADWLRFKTRIERDFLDPLRRRQVPVQRIFYEDFCRDRDRLLGRICAAIGLDAAPILAAAPHYLKVHAGSLSDQIGNWAQLRRDPALARTVAAWDRLITA